MKITKSFDAALLCATLLCGARTAMAGQAVGNGGDAVVCREAGPGSSIVSAELLDYNEGRELFGDPVVPGRTLRESVDFLISRVDRHDPELANELKGAVEPLLEAAEVFEATGEDSNRVRFSDRPLADIPDSLHFAFPAGCGVEQLAIRVIHEDAPGYDDVDYLIQKQLWRVLDLTNKSGILFHEALYKYMSEKLGQPNSRKARYLHGFFASKLGAEMDFADYAAAVAKAGIRRLCTQEFCLDPAAISNRPDGDLAAEGVIIGGNAPQRINLVVFSRDGQLQVEDTYALNPRRIEIFVRYAGVLTAPVVRFSDGTQWTCSLRTWDGGDSYFECEGRLPIGGYSFDLELNGDGRKKVIIYSLQVRRLRELSEFERSSWATEALRNVVLQPYASKFKGSQVIRGSFTVF